jgi:hypothetical protein
MKNGAGMERGKNQLSIDTFASSSGQLHPVQPYNLQHPHQKAINASLIKNLIIGCCLPISLVENKHFREFMNVVDPRYVLDIFYKNFKT